MNYNITTEQLKILRVALSSLKRVNYEKERQIEWYRSQDRDNDAERNKMYLQPHLLAYEQADAVITEVKNSVSKEEELLLTNTEVTDVPTKSRQFTRKVEFKKTNTEVNI